MSNDIDGSIVFQSEECFADLRNFACRQVSGGIIKQREIIKQWEIIKFHAADSAMSYPFPMGVDFGDGKILHIKTSLCSKVCHRLVSGRLDTLFWL